MNPKPLTDADFDRLEELLEHEVFKGDAMRLDEAQAVICAVVSGPEPIMPTIWLPEVLGEGMESGDPVVAETVELLMRLNNDIASALLADETISPILYPVDENCEDYDFEAWADSYVFG
ncbi:MAG: YecA family protein, partial [Dechloromonas sp.]|nr:YecA family protein [Dechloromonas sp.]